MPVTRAAQWLGLFLTLWATARAQAQVTGVFPVHGANLSARESAAIGALFSSAYAEQARLSVLSPSELRPILLDAGSETGAAVQAGLYEYVHLEAVRLDSRIVLYAELRDTYGRSLYAVRDTALSLDDLELVALRMAAALAQPAAALDGRAAAGRHVRGSRRFLEKLFGARFALVMPWAKQLETQASLLAQFDVRLERARYFLELAAGFWLPSRTNSRQGLGGFVGQLGGSYYLMSSSVSAYAGLGVSPRVFAGQFSGVGLAVNAQLGVMLMREASTRLYVEVRVDQNLLRAHPQDAGAARELRGVLPTELSVAVGMGF